MATPSGRPVDLRNVALRVIRPALEGSGVEWRGWYAFRRGLATLATTVEKDPVAAKSLLRHSNVSTTMGHYIKSVPDEAVRAMDKISALFDNRNGSDRPN